MHCSDKCRRAFATKAMNDRRRADRPTICAECGGPLAQPVRGRPRRFCTDKCKQRAGNRRQNRARLPLRNPAPPTRGCAHCGAAFLPKSRDRIYCYDSWCAQAAYEERKREGAPPRMVERVAACDGCGAEFTAKHPSARWCSTKCANRFWGGVRARQRGVLSSARYTDREIFERDNWICHICREPVERTGDRLHPMGATIDHMVPISRGGTDEPENVATAHWLCNRKKGARQAE